MDTETYFVVAGTIIALVLLILNFRIFRDMVQDLEAVIDIGRKKQLSNVVKIEALQADVLRLSIENESLGAALDSYISGNQVLMNNLESFRAENHLLRERVRELERNSPL